MKKILSALLAVTLLLSLAGCGSKAPETPPENSGSTQVQESGGKTPEQDRVKSVAELMHEREIEVTAKL